MRGISFDHSVFGGLFAITGALAGRIALRSAAAGALSGAVWYAADCVAERLERQGLDKGHAVSSISRIAGALITGSSVVFALAMAGNLSSSTTNQLVGFVVIDSACKLFALCLAERCLYRN